RTLSEAIADKIVLRLKEERQSKPKKEKEYVTTAEAAEILGIAKGTMRFNKDKYPHIKSGDKQQGHLLFLRKALTEGFES
ncbi:MAG: hypothetical protein J5510_08370, partial [Prevotella sp.]|nr:hypothetical protein [Prevotella sp.]